MEGDHDDTIRSPTVRSGGWRRQRWWGLMVSLVLAVLVAWPGVRMIAEGDDAPDGFPLSTYAMFTRDRGRIVETPTVVIVDASDESEDEVRRLSPSAIADTDQVIEAHNVVRRAIADGEAASAALCEDVVRRVRGNDDALPDAGADADVEGTPDFDITVQVVVERYDAVEWSAGSDEPLERRVVASC